MLISFGSIAMVIFPLPAALAGAGSDAFVLWSDLPQPIPSKAPARQAKIQKRSNIGTCYRDGGLNKIQNAFAAALIRLSGHGALRGPTPFVRESLSCAGNGCAFPFKCSELGGFQRSRN